MAKRKTFQFSPFSVRQKRILTWWHDESPVNDYDGIIADGSIRSGKTLPMSISFVLWAMERFNGEAFGLCGKTIGAFRRNVLRYMKQTLPPEEPWYKRNPAMMNFVALTIAIIAAGLFVYLPHYLHRSKGADYPTIGFPAPVFQIEPLSDNDDLKPFDSANLAGKTTLLNMWGPWCPPCRQELPHMFTLSKDLSQNPNFQYVSVAYPPDLAIGVEKERTIDGKLVLKINPDVKQQKDLYQKLSVDAATAAGFSGKEIYWDPNGYLANALFQSFPAGKQTGIAFPTTILFDNQKVIRAVWVGYTPGMEKQIEEKVQELLKQKTK